MANGKDEKRDLIMAKAREAFERFGLRKTTMEDIAQGCGLRKASLYYYFKSKEAIVAELMRRVGHKYCRKAIERVEAAGSVGEAFRAFFMKDDLAESDDTVFLLRLAREDLFGLLPLADEALAETEAKNRRILAGVLERGVREGVFRLEDPQRTADTLFHFAKSIHMMAVIEGIETMGQKMVELDEVMALVERGLKAPA